ncbi:20906_t:CDS:1, partial [Gigaspora rosea]
VKPLQLQSHETAQFGALKTTHEAEKSRSCETILLMKHYYSPAAMHQYDKVNYVHYSEGKSVSTLTNKIENKTSKSDEILLPEQ